MTAARKGRARTAEPREAGSRSAPLFGRDTELATARSFIDGSEPLVTIVGPPGIGKTSLARRLIDAQRDVFVDLSGARALDDAVAAIANALGLRDAAAQSRDAAVLAIESALASQDRRVIVLDNVEQIVDELAPLLDRWAAGSRAVLLVTSREILRVPSERCIALSPLRTPEVDERDPARILATDAVRLLVRRSTMRAVYQPSAHDVLELGAIARAVDGIPLALELCASRIDLLGARVVRQRIEEGLAILSRATRGAVPRHQTLGAAIGWSWDLLSRAERGALVRVSVARGGMDIDAAATLVADTSAVAPALGVETLAGLHEHSLLLVDDRTGTTRYRVYEPVRAFALERTDHDAADASERHARYYAARALDQGRRPALAAQRALLLDIENVHVACEHLLEHGDAALGAQALAALTAIYAEGLHGPLDTYVVRLAAARARLQPSDLQAIARVELARGVVCCLLGRVAAADVAFEQARSAAEDGGLREVAAECWTRIGRQRSVERKVDAAHDAFAEAARLHPESDDELTALLGFQEGTAALREMRLDDARLRLDRASSLYLALGNPAQAARIDANRALAMIHAGRYDEARQIAESGVASARAHGLPRIECELLSVCGNVLSLLGHLEEAEAVTERSLALSRSLGLTWFAGVARSGLTVVRLFQGRFDEALELLAGVEVAFRTVGDRDRCAMTAARQAIAAIELGREALANERLEAARASTSTAVRDIADTASVYVELTAARRREDDSGVSVATGRARALLADPSTIRTADLRVIDACLARAIERATDGVDLVVGKDARWFRVSGGERVELVRRRAVRLVLERLVHARLQTPGDAVGIGALFAAGWPGERASESSARNRVHVTLSRLKDLGIRTLLQSRDDGVLLSPRARVVRSAEP